MDVITCISPACLKRIAFAWFSTWLNLSPHARPASQSISPFAHSSFVHLFGSFSSLSARPCCQINLLLFFFAQWTVGTVKSLSAVSGIVWNLSCLYIQHSWSINAWLSHVCLTLNLWCWWMNSFARHTMIAMMRQLRASALNAVFASSLPSTSIVPPIRVFRCFVSCPSSSRSSLIVQINQPTDALSSSSREPSDVALMSLVRCTNVQRVRKSSTWNICKGDTHLCCP